MLTALLLLQHGDSSEVIPFHWRRILLAELPWTFVFEVMLRSVLVFTFAVIALRLLGKRGVSHLSPFEFAILLAFGSLIGDPTFYENVGVVYAMVAVLSIVLLYRGFSWLVEKNETIAGFAESHPSLMVENGLIRVDAIRKERLSHGDLYAMLRREHVVQLGEVRAAYLETSGNLSVYTWPVEKQKPGLRIEPPPENRDAPRYEEKAAVPESGHYSCTFCGETVQLNAGSAFGKCPCCERRIWTAAALATGKNDLRG